MNILFHLNSITERGVTLATIMLAEYNESLLDNQSYLACPKEMVADDTVLDKIVKHFGDLKVCIYDSHGTLDEFILSKNVAWVYCQIHGQKERLPTIICPTFVHAVFTTKHSFGAIYVPISPWLNHHNHTNYPVLPLIAPIFPGSDKSLRSELGISEDSIVFGGLGGMKSFNIPFVKSTVIEVAKKQKNIFFVFMNIEKFCDLPNVIFLPKSTDLSYKEHFINTCNAMIHARGDGETFGIACAEFSIKNKPIISWSPGVLYYSVFAFFYALRKLGMNRYLPTIFCGIRPLDSYAKAHLEFLGEKVIAYTTKYELAHILTHFSEYVKYSNYDCYSDRFSAEKVMKVFKELLEFHQSTNH